MERTIPPRCCNSAQRSSWLDQLPDTVQSLEHRWSLTIGTPFEEASCAWVARAVLANGKSAVLKLAMPHMEGEHEIQGLRFWDGDPTVRLLEADDQLDAMLLELCEPGTPLSVLPEPEQDVVISKLLLRLWRLPETRHPFRPLSFMTEHWSRETLADVAKWPDDGLVREGLRLFAELPATAPTQVLLATNLHAGNVLRSAREPWLVIDPKPFIGDPAYDATQHLFNCTDRLRSDPLGIIHRMADLLGLDRKRVQLWMFAGAAAEPRSDWGLNDSMALARAIAP